MWADNMYNRAETERDGERETERKEEKKAHQRQIQSRKKKDA